MFIEVTSLLVHSYRCTTLVAKLESDFPNKWWNLYLKALLLVLTYLVPFDFGKQ